MDVDTDRAAADPRGLVAVDAGQTGIRLRFTTIGGAPADAVEVERPGVHTHASLTPQWADAVLAAAGEAGRPLPPTVAVGSSGVVEPDAAGLAALLAPHGVRRVLIAHDSVTSYLGALGDEQGAVVAAGTGTICMAVGEQDVARVDGWGHLIGDAGSAFWIGRTGMEAALRGHDGRRQMTALTDALARDFPDLEGAYMELQADPHRVARIAAFSRVVDELAASDRVAAMILDKAAAHLSESVQTALRRVHITRTPKVAALGGVFRSQHVLWRFTDHLTLQWPSFALTEPRGTGLDGAALLAELPDGHALAARIAVADAP